MTSRFPHGPRPLETLVLDDDNGWRQLVSFNVELNLGIQPVLASNAEQAFDIMAARPIDVVISDLFMPEMNGFQFLRLARELFPKTKVILLSGDFDTFPLSPEQLKELGALAAIPKAEISSTLQDLLRTLQEAN